MEKYLLHGGNAIFKWLAGKRKSYADLTALFLNWLEKSKFELIYDSKGWERNLQYKLSPKMSPF